MSRPFSDGGSSLCGVYAASLVAASNRLFSGSIVGSLQLWSIDNSTTPPAVTLHSSMEVDTGAITSAHFNTKMELVRKLSFFYLLLLLLLIQGVVGSTSGAAWYVNWAEQSKLKLIGGHSGKVGGVAFSADSALFASCSLDGSVAVWKPDTREQLVLFQAPGKSCCCVTFAPLLPPPPFAAERKADKKGGGERGGSFPPPPSQQLPALMAGYSDGTVRVFDVSKGKIVRKVQPHAEPVRAVAYFHDGEGRERENERERSWCLFLSGNVIMSGCSAGLVAVSNLSSGLVIRVITDHQGAPITDLQVAPKPIQVRVETQHFSNRYPSPPSFHLWGRCLACCGWLLAATDVSACGVQTGRGTCVNWWTGSPSLHPPHHQTAHTSRKAQRSVGGEGVNSLCQFSCAGSPPQRSYEMLPPSLARFSPCDPDTILYVGYGLERCVQFYSISSKTVFRTLALTHWPVCFAISPQSHLLAFGSHGTGQVSPVKIVIFTPPLERVLKLMDYEEGSFQDFTGHHDTVAALAFSPSGKYLLSASQSIIHFWDITVQ